MLGETLVLFCLIAKCTRVDIMFEQTIINFEMRNVHVPVHNLKIKIEVTFLLCIELYLKIYSLSF